MAILSGRVSLIVGVVLVAAWSWLILVQHVPAGWPHVLYAVGMLLVIRGIALSRSPAY